MRRLRGTSPRRPGLIAARSGRGRAPLPTAPRRPAAHSDGRDGRIPLASEAALEILRQGGSAVDAAIAVQMVLTLVEPQSSGIGGGAFLLHWDGVDAQARPPDGRETAPEERPRRPVPGRGRQAAAISTTRRSAAARSACRASLRMLELAHRRDGTPALGRAVPAGDRPRRGRLLRCRRGSRDAIAEDAGSQARSRRRAPISSMPTAIRSRPARSCAIRPCRDPARDRRAAAPMPSMAGQIAQAIVAEVNQTTAPQRMTPPICWIIARASAHVLCALSRLSRSAAWARPPPAASRCCRSSASCGTSTWRRWSPDGAPALHLLAEASRLAFADRDRYVADADFVRVPTTQLLDPGYLKARAGQIRSDRTIGEARPGKFTDPLIVAQASQRPVRAGLHHRMS